MTISFTSRLRNAVKSLTNNTAMKCSQAKSNCLYTPLNRSGKYVWAKVLDSDGTLIAERPVSGGEGAENNSVQLLLGTIIQSEDATSQTKPNPLGKAALLHVPNGIWVDMDGSKRRRLDQLIIVFVLPKGTAHAHRKKFEVARRNVLNASDIMSGAITIEVARSAGAEEIARKLRATIRPFLVGRGRPHK